MIMLTIRLYQHLREALESQVREDEEGGVDRREGVNASTTALQKQLAAISKVSFKFRMHVHYYMSKLLCILLCTPCAPVLWLVWM